MWAAVRTLRERAALLRRLAGRSGTLAADSFNEKADLLMKESVVPSGLVTDIGVSADTAGRATG